MTEEELKHREKYGEPVKEERFREEVRGGLSGVLHFVVLKRTLTFKNGETLTVQDEVKSNLPAPGCPFIV